MSNESGSIKAINNHIYFYDEVNSANALILTEKLKEADIFISKSKIETWAKHNAPIWLHINSCGGNTEDAFAISDTISMLNNPVFSVIEGLCASAATIISCSCPMKYITLNSFIMIHQFSSFCYGTYEELKDENFRNEILMKTIIDFYKCHTPMSKKQIKKLLKRDSWFNAPMSVEFGLCDKIISRKDIYNE